MLDTTYPYKLPPLDYSYSAMEPAIDEKTMHIHHDKHFQTYINNLNHALEPHDALQKLTLTELLQGRYRLPREEKTTVLNNAGGVYNHALFFDGLSPAGNGPREPQGELLTMIDRTFGSFSAFKATFSKQALAVFGSGWTTLTLDARGRLAIVNLANQDTVVPLRQRSLLLVDVWEHAYYLKYQNMRVDYVNAIWSVLRFPLLEEVIL